MNSLYEFIILWPSGWPASAGYSSMVVAWVASGTGAAHSLSSMLRRAVAAVEHSSHYVNKINQLFEKLVFRSFLSGIVDVYLSTLCIFVANSTFIMF